MRPTLSTASLVLLATGAASACLAGCGSASRTVPVRAGGSSRPPSATASPAASASPARPAKPASERVPDSAVLTVHEQLVPGPTTSASGHEAVITKAATIAEIAAAVNALPTEPRYPMVFCPRQSVGDVLVLDFRASAGGPVLASVQLTPKPTGECGGAVQVTVGTVSEPSLDDSGSANFYARIEQLAGLAAVSPGTPSSTPSGQPSN
jgi:hypothetical protein